MKAPIASPFDVYVPPVRGLGVFLTSGDVVRLVNAPATKLRAELEQLVATGVRWAAVWVESFDGRRAPLATVQRVAAALRGAGLEVAVWTFPAPAQARAAAEHVTRAATAVRARLAILDVEDPDGARGPMDWEPADARTLVDTTIDGLTEHTMLAVSSYPGRRGHGLPWDELVAGVAMPQVYGTADDPKRARDALVSWRDAHGVVVPCTSLRSPGAQHENVAPAQLERRLDAIAIEGVTAAALWSWALFRGSPGHRERVATWAQRRGW